ncbi:MAG TPA: hypothetical protein VFJ43_00220, partial [Bacteroidia bacterium]|nr:hypothetical protein [Bacteroidia bacterium]
MHPRIQRIVTGSFFAGLEIQFLSEGIELYLIVLRRKGHQLIVEKSVTAIESIEKLVSHLPKDIPLAIAFTGKGILHRRIAVDPNSDPKILLSKILPNASLKEFYLQIVPASRDEQFISVLRKSAIDEMLGRLNQFSVVACSLGPLSAISILSLIEAPKPELRFGRHLIQLDNHNPDEVYYEDVSYEKRQFDLGGQKVESENLLAFAAAFQQLLNEEQRVTAHVESLISAKEDFLQRKLFKAGGMALL